MVSWLRNHASPKTAKKKPRVGPIPPVALMVTPYLVIDGASQALEFYRKAFGARELEKSPMPDGKLLHASVQIGDSVVMMSDEFPSSGTKSPTSSGNTTVVLHLYPKNVDKLWKQATDAGAKVAMPLDNQFWGERYGIVVDPFGLRWSMSMKVKMSPKEMEEKRQQAMSMIPQSEQSSTG